MVKRSLIKVTSLPCPSQQGGGKKRNIRVERRQEISYEEKTRKQDLNRLLKTSGRKGIRKSKCD